MPAPIVILGQGLAGSVLAWTFDRAGIDFEVIDRGHAEASSRVGAGIINPVTGQRLVKSWRIDEELAPALALYRDIEASLKIALVRSMRVRRIFRNEHERHVYSEKKTGGDLAPYAGDGDDDGFWIEGGARVDTAALIEAVRVWLRASGRLREETISAEQALSKCELVIDCTGAAVASDAEFAFAGLRPAKGETLTLALATPIAEDVILNAGHWLLPLGNATARVGATFEPGVTDLTLTTRARDELERSAASLIGGDFAVIAHEVGLRMTSPDKHPVIGRSPRDPRRGLINGLGSKGALLAPGLARQWVNHLTEAVPFDPAVDVWRFLSAARK